VKGQKSTEIAEFRKIELLAVEALGRPGAEEVVYVVAEVDGKVVANSGTNGKPNTFQRHEGVIGSATREVFRAIGIGTEMLRALIEQARTMGLRVMNLTAFANNARGTQAYEIVGVRADLEGSEVLQTGRICWRSDNRQNVGVDRSS
jgi:GNAT superfamily N-acetyltransferase